MKKIEALNLNAALQQIKGHNGSKFNLAIMDNIEALASLAKTTKEENTRIVKILQPFEDERLEKAKQLANKDEKGQPIIIDSAYDLSPENLKILNAFNEDLKSNKYKDQFELCEVELKEFHKCLEEDEASYEPILIDRACLPDTLKTEEILKLKLILK